MVTCTRIAARGPAEVGDGMGHVYTVASYRQSVRCADGWAGGV